MRPDRFRRLLFDHPLVKATVIGLLGLVGNVLAGAYVFEITRSIGGVQVLDWRATPSSPSFWLLAAVLGLMGAYGWGSARYESRVRKALTEADVLGIALQELLPAMLDAAKRDIEMGQLRTVDDVRKMFGSGTGC